LQAILKLLIDLLKTTAKKVLKQRLDFPFENKIKTMDRLPKMQGKKILGTTVRFSV